MRARKWLKRMLERFCKNFCKNKILNAFKILLSRLPEKLHIYHIKTTDTLTNTYQLYFSQAIYGI